MFRSERYKIKQYVALKCKVDKVGIYNKRLLDNVSTNIGIMPRKKAAGLVFGR